MISHITGRVNVGHGLHVQMVHTHESTFTISCIVMPVEKAITLLPCNAGRQFDPEIVTRFADLIEAGAIDVRA